MELPAFFTQPAIFEFLFLFTTLTVTFISQTPLLYKCMHTSSADRLSVSILINMALWVLSSFAGIVYIGYMLMVPMERDGNLIFASGSAFVSLTTAVSLSVTFLLLDRIFILTFPMQYKQNRQIFVFATICACGCLILFILGSLIVTELPVEKKTACNSFGCILKRNNGLTFAATKIVIGFVNVIVAVAFEIILCNYTSTTANKHRFKRANVLTTIAALTEFSCNFLPNLIWSIGRQLEIEYLNKAGPIAALFIGVDALLTAFIYRFIITSRRGIRMWSHHFAWTQDSSIRRGSILPQFLQVHHHSVSNVTTNATEHTTNTPIPIWTLMDTNQLPGTLGGLQVPKPLYFNYAS